jgi:4a-hydroxytetrahydrobiopterin dehydratase
VDRRPLSSGEIAERLASLPGWTHEGGALHREFRFADFSEAFGFMARAALSAEKMNHHPSWSNVWSRVVVDLSTHDAGGVTEWDVALAREMDRLAASHPPA